MSDDYLPARMINEFSYCPRLFYLMHVEGQFADSVDTIDGQIVHQRVDSGDGQLNPPTIAPEPLLEKDQPSMDPTLSDPQGSDRGSLRTLPLFDDLDQSLDSTTHPNPKPSTSNDKDRACTVSDQATVIHARSVTLSSDTLGVIAKLDLAEVTGNVVVPVDYKRGRPRTEPDGSLGAWPPEKIQICLQALVLRENGYQVDHGLLYFAETRQRVHVPLDPVLLEKTRQSVSGARRLMDNGVIPEPLVNSPKCPRCSLVSICLPDETRKCATIKSSGKSDKKQPVGASIAVRPLIAVRDERRPLYLNTQGLHVGKKDEVLQIKDKSRLVQEVRIHEINQVNLFGSIQISTQTVQTLLHLGVPIAYYTQRGWFYGLAAGLGLKNIQVRREQFRAADRPVFCLDLARQLIQGKIRNQRTLLMRNHRQPDDKVLRDLKRFSAKAVLANSLASLLGIEGSAARLYFQNFVGMIKTTLQIGSQGQQALTEPTEVFHFRGRNRRPPRDPVNALLSLAYSLLTKDLLIACTNVGLDPHLGFYHQVKAGKPALALDLMEPFRPLIADSAVLSALNNKMVTADDFIQAGQSVVLSTTGRKHFLQAYEQRMDRLVTHPLFGYRVSYRRLLEIQTRLLGRLLTGEIQSYPVFTTR